MSSTTVLKFTITFWSTIPHGTNHSLEKKRITILACQLSSPRASTTKIGNRLLDSLHGILKQTPTQSGTDIQQTSNTSLTSPDILINISLNSFVAKEKN
jgi:hypothetical protein